MGDWVLIFIQLSGGTLGLSPSIQVQPIYFQTADACHATAKLFNNGGPEPSAEHPKQTSNFAVGAICRPTK